MVGAGLMLFQGLKLLFANWRLTLVQVLPAMWIWVAMIDLKAHILHGASFHVLRGPILIPIILGVAGITAASFYLNAVFAFAISRHGGKEIRPAFAEARGHLGVVLAWGLGIGLMLGFATMITSRWGRWPFTIAMSIVIAIMMICYLACRPGSSASRPKPTCRDTGRIDRERHRRCAGGGGLLAALSAGPGFGVLLLGSFFVPGLILLIIGLTLQAGATSAVKSIKMSAKLVSGTDTASAVQPTDAVP